MSQNSTPGIVYQRKRSHKDPSISETEPINGVKPHNSISHLSTSSTRSRNFAPNLIYQRKSPHMDPVSLFETQAQPPHEIKPTFIYQCKRPCENPVSIHETELPNGISQLSTSSSMSRDSPIFVYQRRRARKEPFSSVEIDPSNGVKPSDGCQSAVSSERVVEDEPDMGPVKCSTVAAVYTDRYENVKESCFGMGPTSDLGRVLIANENCSSSKSNLELSPKLNTDDAGECSSSGALIEKKSEEIAARDVCILILRSQGLLDRAVTRQNEASNKNGDYYCSRLCRVCERMESTQHMLICDNCTGSFHVSCYNPPITVLPTGEWLCNSCLKKRHKILKDKSSGNSTNVSNKIGRNRCSAPGGELGSLEYMFRDSEPHMSNVRVGDEFQAWVPNWSGPAHGECYLNCGVMELDPSDYFHIKEEDPINPLNLSSIGNWLQCRGVIEGVGEAVDGTVCAKWRRAPLFEVQTDNWECFNCVLWDPSRADCAVPQELDTDKVLMQLKYMEMLRPRLAAKRRKTGQSSKSIGEH